MKSKNIKGINFLVPDDLSPEDHEYFLGKQKPLTRKQKIKVAFVNLKTNILIEYNKLRYLLILFKHGVLNYGNYSEFVMDEFVEFLTKKHPQNKKLIDVVVSDKIPSQIDGSSNVYSKNQPTSDLVFTGRQSRINTFVQLKKLSDDAVLPSYANEGDACFDLVATSVEVTDSYIEYGTGWAMELQYGTVGLIYPRSSISKTDLVLANSVGVIDSGYRGEIKFRFKNVSKGKKQDSGVVYKVGDRVGQMMILPLPKVHFDLAEELIESERGNGGFGSSGQ